jgi:hypothetical protein
VACAVFCWWRSDVVLLHSDGVSWSIGGYQLQKKMKGKDIVVCFNVILLYVEAVSVVRGVTI